MSHNLRVFYYHDPIDGGWTFTFRRVWYDEDGEIVQISREPLFPMGESAGDLEELVAEMRAALALPRLSTDVMGTMKLV